MKVLEIIPNLNSGGAERLLVELANELANNCNVDVEVMTAYDFDRETSINYKMLDPRVQVTMLSKKKGIDLGFFWKVYKAVKRSGADVAHFHVGAITYALVSAFLNKRTKHIATIHSDAAFEAGGRFSTLVRKLIFGKGKCIPVTISEKSLDSFKSFYGMDAPLIYNGVSRQDISEDDNPIKQYKGKGLVFASVASVQPVKNQKLLVRTFDRLIREGYDVTLLMMGNIHSFKHIYDEDVAPFLSERIVHLGMRSDVVKILHFADAMCLTSKMEGMPMTIIEAFSQGCIPICTPVGGIVDMVQSGVNGILSDDLSEEAYYNAIKRFIEMSDAEKRNMREQAHLSFKRFDIKTTASKYMDIFNG